MRFRPNKIGNFAVYILSGKAVQAGSNTFECQAILAPGTLASKT
jgi:hypothetical protein